MWFPAVGGPEARPDHSMLCMIYLQSTKGSRSPSLEGNRPGFLKPLAPQQGNGRSGPGLGYTRAQVMQSGTPERHGGVDSGKLRISREELEGLACKVEGA